jgi:hypothetical protein
MGDQSESITPPPITCRNCGGTWPQLWVVRREIELCPYCRADLAPARAAESLPDPAASSG